MFTVLISEVAQKFGLGDKAGGLLVGVLSLITNADNGGLAGFIGKFTGAGLGNVVNSWVSRGENTALTNDQLSSVLGNQTIHNMADKVGISPALAMPALAYMLPKVVDALTPDGVVPSSLPNTITNYISNFGGMLGKGVGTVTGAAGDMASGAAGAVGAGWRWCGKCRRGDGIRCQSHRRSRWFRGESGGGNRRRYGEIRDVRFSALVAVTAVGTGRIFGLSVLQQCDESHGATGRSTDAFCGCSFDQFEVGFDRGGR